MRLCLYVYMCFLFGCFEGKPRAPIKEPCSAWRNETAYLIWIDGCMTSVSNLFPENQKPHPFPLSDHCSDLFHSQ